MYADDTVIYVSESTAEIIVQVLQIDLHKVEKWLASNRLVLNQKTSKWMLFGKVKVKSAPIVIGRARTTHQCRRLTLVSIV